jgi:Mg/Co/Ni transporter MgtE
VKLDPYILNFGDATLLTQILEVLSPKDAIQAFIRINECSTRKAIIDALTSQSRELVNKALTDHLMEGVRDSTQEMLGISTIATKRFL